MKLYRECGGGRTDPVIKSLYLVSCHEHCIEFCLFLVFCSYLSLRLDGRVRGSSVGYPPWNALVGQLPPVKGTWSGLLDGRILYKFFLFLKADL